MDEYDPCVCEFKHQVGMPNDNLWSCSVAITMVARIHGGGNRNGRLRKWLREVGAEGVPEGGVL